VVARALSFGDYECFGILHRLPPLNHLIPVGGSSGATLTATTWAVLQEGVVIGEGLMASPSTMKMQI